MRYRRLGSGPPLVLLGATDRAEELAGQYRVLIPEMPPFGDDVTDWLSAFLDGLGTTDVTLLAAGPFHDLARDLALADPDRVIRVILDTR